MGDDVRTGEEVDMTSTKDVRSKEISAQLAEMRKDPVEYYARLREQEARKYRGLGALRLLRVRHRSV